jgi:hypothetical protein
MTNADGFRDVIDTRLCFDGAVVEKQENVDVVGQGRIALCSLLESYCVVEGTSST